MKALEFSRRLRQLQGDLASDAFESEKQGVMDEFGKAQAENFLREEGPDGPWAPRKHSYSHPILRKTYRMYRAATLANASDSVQQIEHRRLVLGVSKSVHYAKYHRDGTKNKDGSVRMPARPFLYLNAEARQQVKQPFYGGLRRILFNRMRG